jgi:hypothetical protein
MRADLKNEASDAYAREVSKYTRNLVSSASGISSKI